MWLDAPCWSSKTSVLAVLVLLSLVAEPVRGTRRGLLWNSDPPPKSKPHKSQLRAPLPSSAEVVRPVKFDQRLLICNAYPSKGRMTVKKTTKEVLADLKHAVPFRACQYFDNRVQRGDTLNLAIDEFGVHGSFEVGELPSADVVLLLVLEKNDQTSLVRFQSFAFSPNANGKDAQVAVIDAFTGNSSTPRLKMEDHITGKEAQTVSKRVEQLAFDRIYAIEPGSYDVSILDHTGDMDSDTDIETKSRKLLTLAHNQNYVVLRTGDAIDYTPTLVVFPDGSARSSSLQSARVAGLVLFVMAATTFCFSM